MIMLRRTLVILVLALASGCASAAQSVGPTTDPSPATPSVASSESGPEIPGTRVEHPSYGSWSSTVTTAGATAALKKWHLENWAEQFIEQEKIAGALAHVTFHGDTFSIAYDEGDIWHVAWHGPCGSRRTSCRSPMPKRGSTDTFAWRIDGDQLTLTPQRTDATGLYKGIPEFVYDVGYFESIPLTRTACDPATPTAEPGPTARRVGDQNRAGSV